MVIMPPLYSSTMVIMNRLIGHLPGDMQGKVIETGLEKQANNKFALGGEGVQGSKMCSHYFLFTRAPVACHYVVKMPKQTA
jgi:hypothetical protein